MSPRTFLKDGGSVSRDFVEKVDEIGHYGTCTRGGRTHYRECDDCPIHCCSSVLDRDPGGRSVVCTNPFCRQGRCRRRGSPLNLILFAFVRSGAKKHCEVAINPTPPNGSTSLHVPRLFETSARYVCDRRHRDSQPNLRFDSLLPLNSL